jgi:uncharacterized protein (DUF2141 family)
MKPHSQHLQRYPALCLILASCLWQTNAHAAELHVTIENIEAAEGTLMIAVQAGPEAFAGREPAVLSLMLPARAGAVGFSTDALAPGEYAIRVLQDRNGNGEMDSNLIGMPVEPWGMSNDAMGSFGPPKWEDARFQLQDDTRLVIHLNQ